MTIKTITWNGKSARILDQTRLPAEEYYLEIKTIDAMAEAIQSLRIRGAPAIGIAGAYGLVIGARSIESLSSHEFKAALAEMARRLTETRPTAINLKWAIDRIMGVVKQSENDPPALIVDSMEKEALRLHDEDIELCRRIGIHGAQLMQENPISILTHCNAGLLATGGQGTALSVVYEIKKQQRSVEVFADETRPLFQGSRLTAWELERNGVPVTLLCDNMAGHLMKSGRINCVIVGADRIAANGDTANKIGTFTIALLADHFKIPFYVAAPYSTFDLETKTGEDIPIEERKPAELRQIGDNQLAPENIGFFNPAFDVTPNHLIAAFITDRGVIRPPYLETIAGSQLKS